VLFEDLKKQNLSCYKHDEYGKKIVTGKIKIQQGSYLKIKRTIASTL